MFLLTKKSPLPQKLNICLTAKRFPLLGRAVDHGFLWPIAKTLAQKGHNVTVLSWKNPQGKYFIHKDKITAYFLGEETLSREHQFEDLVLDKFKKLHSETPFHIVHSLDRSGIRIAQNKKSLHVAVAFDVDATQMSKLYAISGRAQETTTSLLKTALSVVYKFLTTYYGGDRAIIRKADGIFVTSPQQRLILERYYLYPWLKTYVVPYGIEIGDLSAREHPIELKEKLNFPSNAHVAMTITDMTEFEEIKHLLRAFEKVTIKKTSARLLIVGNGPLKKQIEYEILQLALGNRAYILDQVPQIELADYISLADVFINLSSRTTGFEPSLLEAMAQKKVIIGSEVSPISTIVEDGVDGFLLRPADRQSLTKLLLKLFTGQILSDNIGERARKKVLNLFDVDKMTNETLKAYFQTLLSTPYYKPQTRPVNPSLAPASN